MRHVDEYRDPAAVEAVETAKRPWTMMEVCGGQTHSILKFGLDELLPEAGGLVLQGRLRPPGCPEFGGRCTPSIPLGATMVSSEGAYAAYFHYRRAETPAPVPAGR